MVQEVVVENAFTTEGQPDGTSVVIVDPYTGCELKCPYCFQWNDPDWGKKILVNLNIPELLSRQIDEIKDTGIYIGSKCDPYMPLEQKYHLTRRCLEVLSRHTSHVYITTKSDNRLILADSDLLKSFQEPVTVLMGLSNISQADRGRENSNIQVANGLKKQGIDVWCYITPVLPYIMNINEMVDELDDGIPVYFDKLRVMTQGNQDQKILSWIRSKYPQYLDEYARILFDGDTAYYRELYTKYSGNPRCKFMTDEWGA